MATIAKNYTSGDFANDATAVGTVVQTALDTIYDDYNGGITDANISAAAAIQQAKILNLVTNLASKVNDSGDTITGELKLKFSSPYVRFTGTEASAKDWRIVEDGSDLKFQENTGTEASPTWTTRYTLPDGAGGPATGTDLATKTYVDKLTSGLGVNKTTKTDADFTTTSATFVDVTGLSVAMTNVNANRVRVSVIINVSVNAAATAAVDLQVDSTSVAGTGGLIEAIFAANEQKNMSFTFLVDAQTAAAHTYKVRVKTSAGTLTVHADASVNAIISAEEAAVA